ncbi:MAG TPA: TonB family protein [Opitutaceae bacterium]|nr:TonB family protein [Opitutaceae bacterium]
MKYHPLLLLLAAAPFAATTHAQSHPAPRALGPELRIEHYVEPIFPVQLRNKSVNEGFVQIQILVAADGTLLETFVSEYSREEFATTTEAAIRNWRFRPAADPGALPQRINLRIDFRNEGMLVVQGDFQETVNAFFGHRDREPGVTLCRLSELDAIPEPVNLVVPEYPADLKAQGVQGSALVSFFIDETGQVHVAANSGSTRPEFAAAAVAAVKQWTFAPPMRKGAATRVFAVQEFAFTPDKTPAAPTAGKR